MIWQNILRYRRNEYPNICKLVSLVVSMSGSNSTVERAFSVLSSILSDRRLSLAHKVINNIMMIKANDKNWSQDERADVIERALAIYLSKRRVRQVEEVVESPNKVRRMEATVRVSSSEEELDDDDEELDDDGEELEDNGEELEDDGDEQTSMTSYSSEEEY